MTTSNTAARLQAAAEVAARIPGWLEPEVVQYLYRLGAESSGDVLEIGTYFGKSTYLIARGMNDAGRSGKVVTVDVHWRGVDPVTNRPLVLAEDSQLALCRTLKEQRLEDSVIQMIGWSHACVSRVDFRAIESVFIDGGHDYESCSGDFLAVRERIPPGRKVRLMFHDYGDSFPGVQRTIDELVRRDERFRYLGQIGSLFICELVPRV